MSTEQVNNNMYGYATDEVKQSSFGFGLNAGAAILKTFEWIPNGGADGAEKEALEIIFTINGTDKGYRKFPVTQGFGKKGEVITDPNSAEFKDAVMTLNSVITHILRSFVSEETLKKAFSVPISSFKQFCTIAAGLLPKNFNEVKLDIFMQYQWSIRPGQNRTYLEIPSSMKNGKWLCPAVPPVGEWKEVRKKDPSDNDQKALIYVDEAGNIHPFTRYGRYVNGNLANIQKTEEAEKEEAASSSISQGGSSGTPSATQTEAGW